MAPIALELPAFLFGLLLGSFLNVCIARLPRGESIVSPRSRCPACHHPIRWFDNIPVLSWLLLRGRCRDCKTRISFQYPLVELAVALWFLLAASRMAPLLLRSGPVPLPLDTLLAAIVQTVALAILGFLLLGLLIMDWQTQILPDSFTFGGIAAAFFLVCCQAILLGPTDEQIRLSNHHIHLSSPGNVVEHGNLFLTGPEALIGGRLLAVTAAALFLLGIRWLYRRVRGREGMGLGDVKLIAMIAAFLGFSPAVLALFIGVVLGAVYSIVLLATRRADGHSRIPLGTFLAFGGLLAGLYGQEILGWYKGLL